MLSRLIITLTLLTTLGAPAFAGPGDGVMSQEGYDWVMKPVPKETSKAHHLKLVEILLEQTAEKRRQQARETAPADVWVCPDAGGDAHGEARPTARDGKTRIDELLRRLWVGPAA